MVGLRALIFDVGGTVCEAEDAHRQAFNDTFTAQSIDWRWGGCSKDSTNGLRSARAAGLRAVVTPSVFTLADDFTGATLIRADLTGFDLAAARQVLTGSCHIPGANSRNGDTVAAVNLHR